MNDQSGSSHFGRRHGFGWACLALAALVIVPISVYGLAGESDRWQAALLLEKYLDAEVLESSDSLRVKQECVDSMREIVKRRSENRQLKMLLAQWLLDCHKASEALEWVEAISPADRDMNVGELYLRCLLANARADDALELFRELHPASTVRKGEYLQSHLNRLAYMQALAGKELVIAMRNSNKVVAEVANTWQATVKDELPARLQIALAAVLVYRGSCGLASNGHEIATVEYKHEIMAILEPVIASLSTAVDTSQSTGADNVEALKSSLATMLTARSLVLQDLGEMELSFADRRKIAELGRDATKIASRWPRLRECFRHLSVLASFLDTRGCVFYMEGESDLAIVDLNAAIIAQEAICKTGPRLAATWEFETADLREFNTEINQQWNRNLAVLLFHRSWIRRSLAQMASSDLKDPMFQRVQNQNADNDLARVREMGFKAGYGLF